MMRDAGILLGTERYKELIIHIPSDLFVKIAGLYAIQMDKDKQTIHESITNYLRGQERELFAANDQGSKAMYACLQILPTAISQVMCRLVVENQKPQRFKAWKEAVFGKTKSMGAYVEFTGGKVLQSTAEAQAMFDELMAKDGMYVLRGESCHYEKCKSLIANLPVNSILYKAPELGGLNIVTTPSGTEHIINDKMDEVIAVRIGPMIAGVTCHARSIASMARALRERIEMKQRPLTVSSKERARLYEYVTKICQSAFSKEKVLQWMVDHPIFDELKSNSWSPARFAHAMDDLRSGREDLDEVVAQIKAEVTARSGKSARIILNCGEYNQLCSLLVCRCFEDLVFTLRSDVGDLPAEGEWCNLMHIKHQDKVHAMAEFVEDTHKQGGFCGVAIEGDGSAWDTTCSATVRDCTTNQAFQFIWKAMVDTIYPDGPAPKQVSQNVSGMSKKKLIAKVSTNASDEKDTPWMKKARISIDAIQESGARPTSCSNFFVNLTLWTNALFRNPIVVTSQNLKRRHVLDIRNAAHHFEGAPGATYSAQIVSRFEGDDSLLRLVMYETIGGKARLLTPEQDARTLNRIFKMVEELWIAWGFNMKLVFAWEGQVVTFCGCNTLNQRQGFARVVIPEVMRGLATSSWSVSSMMKQHGLDTPVGRAIARDSYLARAASYPNKGLAGLLRGFYLKCAQMNMDAGSPGTKTAPQAQMSFKEAMTMMPSRQLVPCVRGMLCVPQGYLANSAFARLGKEIELPRLTKIVDRDLARKVGCEVGSVVDWHSLFERADEAFESYTEKDIDELIEKTAGVVTPEERATLESAIVQADMWMARALLPSSWARRLTAVYESEGLNHIL